MAPSSCASCGAAATPQHPLKACHPCRKVAYCDRTCQKAHWKIHKPDCLELRKGWKDEDGNIIAHGEVHPPGTYVEYFEPPNPETPEFPDGHHRLVFLGPDTVMQLASRGEEVRREYEKDVIKRMKAGVWKEEDYLAEIEEKKKKKQEKKKSGESGAEKADATPIEYQNLLATLTAKYKADQQEAKQKHPKCDGKTTIELVRIDEEKNLIIRNLEGVESMLPADGYVIHTLAPSADFPKGFEEMIPFSTEIIDQMKDLEDEEKQKYKEFLAKKALAKRYAGMTAAQVTANRKERQAKLDAMTGVWESAQAKNG